MRYFRYDNASRALKLGDVRFVFDVVGQFAGSWVGVFATDKENEIALLLEKGSVFGVVEITADEYEAQLKKKLPSQRSTQTSAENKILLPRPGRQSAAVVVKHDGAPPSQTKAISNPPTVKVTVDEVVVLGKAPYVEPLEAVAKSKKKSKK